MAKVYLTEKLIRLIREKFLGHSDPIMLCGKVIAQQIKGTAGITG